MALLDSPYPGLTALVVDDEPLAARRLARALEAEPGVTVAGLCHEGPAAVRAIEESGCDVVFLDIRMPGQDGMAVARALAGEGAPMVVFVTAFSQFAPDAFGVDAVDYLLKPVETERLRAALSRLRKRREASQAVAEIAELRESLASQGAEMGPPSAAQLEIWAPTAHGAVRLFADQIDWIGSEDDYVRLYVGAKTYLLRATLQDLMAKVTAEDFIRVHRSAAVNLNRIQSMTRLPYGALRLDLSSGQAIRVSRSHAAALRRRLREPSKDGRVTLYE